MHRARAMMVEERGRDRAASIELKQHPCRGARVARATRDSSALLRREWSCGSTGSLRPDVLRWSIGTRTPRGGLRTSYRTSNLNRNGDRPGCHRADLLAASAVTTKWLLLGLTNEARYQEEANDHGEQRQPCVRRHLLCYLSRKLSCRYFISGDNR